MNWSALRKDKDLFHVHTYRCGHAANIADEEYVKAAIALSYESIWFTDHAPFPGNPFYERMDYKDLNKYINDLKQLKEKYEDQIAIHIGFEIEYFRKYESYYSELRSNSDVEILLLGQHMGSMDDGHYTFDINRKLEMPYIVNNILEGIESGYFPILAHPERAFKQCQQLDGLCEAKKREIIEAAQKHNIVFEQNAQSHKCYPKAFSFFWTNNYNTYICGADAHCTEDIKEYNNFISKTA